MSRNLLICAAWLAGAGTAMAIDPLPGQLGYDDVVHFATPGAVWCFEPQKDSCMFMTVSTEPVKGNPRYDVMELWDENQVLIVHTGGVLRGDGLICEQGISHFDTLELTDLDGSPASPDELEAVRAELQDSWAGYEEVEYCYAYVPAESGEHGYFDQIQYADGERVDGALTFVISYAADAMEHYRLRPLD